MKLALALSVSLLSAAAVAAPSAQNVSVDCSKASNVKVTYELTEDAVVTVKFRNNGVEIPDEKTTRLVGDVCRKVKATGEGEVRTFYWASDLEEWDEADSRTFASLTCEVTAWATNAPPLYMAADLEAKSNVTFYASKASVPGGITNRLYKTTKMLFRKIPAKEVTWWSGGPANSESDGLRAKRKVYFTDDYYIGVYEVTQKQNELYADFRSDQGDARNAENADLRAANSMSYERLLGNNKAMTPASDSYIGKLISHTGILSLNLPTEAQWEYACRALTGKKFLNDADSPWESSFTDYTWCKNYVPENLVQPVGMKLPNNWDLYDMAGNLFELCLDWYAVSTYSDVAVTDPCNTTEATSRVRRGGCYANDVWYCRSARVTTESITSKDYGNGHRPSIPFRQRWRDARLRSRCAYSNVNWYCIHYQ